eukprot:TRINITY_DN7468_c0_g1_i1.p1 TRINITY_DN7468_c0_g1~~TRINITY_DN7468_c0_g1_i1.p1  ORF type:complete len:252 (+),score=34.69 TRINITY_DN7468_c0_g1_i1:131-886(+)
MKLTLFVIAISLAVVSAIDTDGFDVMPYCFNVTNGRFDLLGEPVELASLNQWGPSNAIFINGLNLGLDQNPYWSHELSRNASFLNPDGVTNNGTLNPFLYTAAYWDFAIVGWEEVGFTYALGDGTFDTVDIAMAFAFNQTHIPVTNETNFNVMCSEHGVEVHNDNTLNELQVVQYFYVAKWQYDSWARVAVVVTNTTNADINTRLGFNNNVGTDGDTLFVVKTPRYVIPSLGLHDTAIQENNGGFSDNLAS